MAHEMTRKASRNWRVALALFTMEVGPVITKELQDHQLLSPHDAKFGLDTAVRKGWAIKRPDPNHGKRKIYEITRDGLLAASKYRTLDGWFYEMKAAEVKC